MANIVKLREMSGDTLEEMLENAREEMFNLRFQKASARLEDTSRVKHVRREIAQLQTVLHMRQLAKDVAAQQPEIASVLAGTEWRTTARFIYEESAWRVTFFDEDDDELAFAMVDLNRMKTPKRRGRRTIKLPRLVTSYEIAG